MALFDFVQAVTNVSAFGGTVSASITPTAGNTLVVLLQSAHAFSSLEASDDQAQTYTPLISIQDAAYGGSMSSASNVFGVATSVTGTVTGSVGVSIIILEFSGNLAWDRVASAASTTSSGNTAATTVADELVIGACVTDTNTAAQIAIDGSYTTRSDVLFLAFYQSKIASKVVSATGTQVCNVTLSFTPASSFVMCATFKNTVAAPAPSIGFPFVHLKTGDGTSTSGPRLQQAPVKGKFSPGHAR